MAALFIMSTAVRQIKFVIELVVRRVRRVPAGVVDRSHGRLRIERLTIQFRPLHHAVDMINSTAALDLLSQVALELNLTPAHYRGDLVRQIPHAVVHLNQRKKQHPILICDEAQLLPHPALLLNFDMDSSRYLTQQLKALSTERKRGSNTRGAPDR
jgi:hypothetical protein